MQGNTGDNASDTGRVPAVASGGPAAGPPPAIDVSSVDVPVAEPTADRPVALGAVVHPSQANPGDKVVLVVRAKMFAPWHIYAAEGPTGVGIPTRLQIDAPGWVAASAWALPAAHVEQSPLGPMSLYEGDVRFVAELQLADDAPAGQHAIAVTVTYQSCNDTQCLPPTK
ncbi:MAG: hypothetical protein D6753_08375, partial [Planctomycetota bacterium]